MWLLLAVIIGAMGGWLYCKLTATQYKATQTFFLNNEEVGVQNGLQGVLGAVGWEYSDEDQKIEKIKVIAQSDRLWTAILLQDHQGDFLANQLIDQQNLTGDIRKWQGDLANHRLTTNKEEDLSEDDRRLLNVLISAIKGDLIDDFSYGFFHDKKSGLMKIELRGLDEMLSTDICSSIYAFLSEFYIEKTVERPSKTLRVLQERQDSVGQKLAAAEAQLASYDSKNLSLWSPSDKYKRDRLAREVGILSVAYGETIKNVQLAEFVLQNTTPYFQEVDGPRSPLPRLKPSIVKWMPVGAFFAGCLALLMLILSKFVSDAMSS